MYAYMYVQLNKYLIKYNVDGLVGQSLGFTLQAPKLNVKFSHSSAIYLQVTISDLLFWLQPNFMDKRNP